MQAGNHVPVRTLRFAFENPELHHHDCHWKKPSKSNLSQELEHFSNPRNFTIGASEPISKNGCFLNPLCQTLLWTKARGVTEDARCFLAAKSAEVERSSAIVGCFSGTKITLFKERSWFGRNTPVKNCHSAGWQITLLNLMSRGPGQIQIQYMIR